MGGKMRKTNNNKAYFFFFSSKTHSDRTNSFHIIEKHFINTNIDQVSLTQTL